MSFPSRRRRPAPAQSCRGARATHLALRELAEHRCQPVIVNVTVRFNGNIQDVNGLLAGSLRFKQNIPHKQTVSNLTPVSVAPDTPLKHREGLET